jgi:hypothetical protein
MRREIGVGREPICGPEALAVRGLPTRYQADKYKKMIVPSSRLGDRLKYIPPIADKRIRRIGQ